ncbi:VWA domain-containing protein [Halocalculus aciditolerans]|uniref:VWA domain-containing protein n=1 Tax=Halocalculus aciditolerans TaxID=1383812 RepID=A0A830FKV3_9EURY|nr:VWA domain-containing protein [Halocalculus aciditolerans]GGL56384.1 VWA domain-containing protein [Halocalculus aciditolerans]
MSVDPDTLRDELLRFVRELSESNVAVPANGALAAARALDAVERFEEAQVRAALRATLVTREADLEPFDRLFSVFWTRVTGEGSPAYADGRLSDDVRPETGVSASIGGTDPNASEVGDDRASGGSAAGAGATVTPGSNDADADATTAQYSPAGSPDEFSADAVAVRDTARVEAAVRAFTRAVADLPGRRWQQSGRGRPDTRAALRRSLSAGGAPLPLPEQSRKETAAKGIVLVDVSQSVLDTVDRGFLLQFVAALRREWRRTRVFFFDTDVREVSTAFDAPSIAAAVRELEAAQTEWGGGTRIGHALAEVRDTYPDAVDWATTAVVVSDGLERGELDELEGAMAWLSRRASRVLWLNPLAVSERYEPTARGMATALPFVDGLYGFAGPDDLERVAAELAQYGPRTELAARGGRA